MAGQERKSDVATQDDRARLTFHYIKSNAFRVIHADGAWGGITPRLKIQMALYSERTPIPQQTIHQLTDAHTLGDELKEERISREGIIREVEAEVIMDIETAESLASFLNEKIVEAKGILGEAKGRSDA